MTDSAYRRARTTREKGEQAATSTLVIGEAVSYLKWKKAASSIPRFVEFLQSLPALTKAETSFDDFR